MENALRGGTQKQYQKIAHSDKTSDMKRDACILTFQSITIR